LLEDLDKKRKVLNKLVEKCTPQFAGKELRDNMIKGTAVIEIDMVQQLLLILPFESSNLLQIIGNMIFSTINFSYMSVHTQ